MILPATWPHVLAVSLAMRDDDRREVNATRWAEDPYDFAADCMRTPGPKLAAIRQDGTPVAIGGVATHHPGVGQAWLVGTHNIGLCGIEIAHACRKSIAALFADGGLHRIQAHSAAFHTDAHRWLKAIGLREESRLPGYGKGGEEFVVFSILRGD